jgi:hypothetical protein
VTDGETKTTLPKWIGIKGISDTLASTRQAVAEIVKNSNGAFNDNGWTKTDPQSFEKQLASAYTTYSSQNLNNPNPSNSKKGGQTKIVPLYISKYGDYPTSGTELNGIYQEFNTKIKASATALENAQSYSTNIAQASDKIDRALADVQKNIDSFSSTFTNIEDTILKNWIMYQNTANDTGGTGFFILFAVLTGLVFISLLGIILYVCCKAQCARYILHFVWIITCLIMILTFILGTLFGIIGLASKDGVPVLQYVFGSENLSLPEPKILKDATAAKYINTCINRKKIIEFITYF